MAKVQIKPTAITRAGYEYQDLAGIELLIRQYRDSELYTWVQLEADDTNYRALDDIVAARKDGSYEFVQVKFTVDSDRYELDWDWLLAKTSKGTSMLEKWVKALVRVAAMGPIHSAGLKTNRIPSVEFAKCLKGARVDLDLLPKELRDTVEEACGGASDAKTFFCTFDFLGGLPDLDQYENYLRDQLVPTDTDSLGWLAFRHNVRRWATYKNQPEPDGRILHEHVVQLITKRRPQSIRQDFIVPDSYAPPSEAFDKYIRERILKDENPITILWGTPGRGKSTYLSNLTRELQKEGAAVTRHHYFLSAEDSSSNRNSFVEIATSLMDQLHVRHPEAMAGVKESADEKLRFAIGSAAGNLAAKNQRLFIVVDGLDHVWRDTRRVDQLNHLFNELLPLPPNVSLIVGTQRVTDEQLPGKLIMTANEDDWIEIPRMDEVAVHRWVVQQNKTRPLILRFDPTPQRRAEMIDEIAITFFNISQGHPLHLIYVYEELVRAGRPTSAEEIGQLPTCPDGDIRVYYLGLWCRLSSGAKNALHMLAGSDFFWPSLGIRQVLGDFSEVDHLLEPRNVGMVPFHSSIFAWVRERPDHVECYQALLPKIIDWLENEAPEYWRWGWLWLVRAQAGDFKELLAGATRDWVVESFMKGWSDQQIENILAAAEAKTFEDGDLSRTISFRSLKTRVSNAREFQSRNFAAYRATALAVSNNRQQALNLLDDIHDLTDIEVTELARLCPDGMSSQILPICLKELARRVNAWIALRHRPEQDFNKLSDQLLSVSALSIDEETVRRTLNYTRGFKKSEPHVLRLINLLGDAQNIKGLQVVANVLSGTKWSDERRSIYDALIRTATLAGANVRELVHLDKEPLSVFAASWFLLRNHDTKLEVHILPVPRNITRERYSLGEDEEITSFFYDAFWIALYVGFRANGNDYSMSYPGLGKDNFEWLPQGLEKLEDIARDIAEGRLPPTFSAVYAETMYIEPVQWSNRTENEYVQYSSFRAALLRVAIDLHFLGFSSPGTKISASELSVARESAHWSDEIWLTRNVSDRIQLLTKDAAAALLTDLAISLSAKVTEFSERGERWTQLADLARLYKDGRQAEFLAHAAECLVGYGWRKDLSAMDVLDAVVELTAKDPAVTRTRLDTLVPIIEVITDFTDGDETNHVRSELIEVVAKVAPERLPPLYKQYLSRDEYSYADKCLTEFTKTMDLSLPEGAALARTFLDELTLGVLDDRAVNEPVARALLDVQNGFLGRTPKAHREVNTTDGDLSEQEKQAAKVDPKSFGYEDFAAVVAAAGAIHYKSRKEFMMNWLHHWKYQNKASRALHSIFSYFETNDTAHGAEEILDEAFLVSLAIEGKDAAYPWLIRAHIHRNGWSDYSSETEKMTRLRLAAQHYPDRWLQYIKDTSVPAPFLRRRRYSFVLGYNYLVRFLMLVGQVELADKITTSLVDSLVEEVREQPIPETPWFEEGKPTDCALSFLFQRLKWPVPMSRWRTAKEIRNLLKDSATRPSTTDMLLSYLDQCQTESEVCEIFTIVFLTPQAARPSHTALVSRVHCPSILADIILERTYERSRGLGGWRQAHSGSAPYDFDGGSYFEEHKTAHVPPILMNNLMRLERSSGYPFHQHWAYEWKSLVDKLGTRYTRYPHYFDDVLDARSGITGQYWQRMSDAFLSAYLRTLAYAVNEWRLPQRLAETYCLDIVHGIAGLFDVDPGIRPAWLSDFPEKLCAPGVDLAPDIRGLIQTAQAEGMKLVSLDTPVKLSMQKFAKLTLSAHLVTPDYELPDGILLFEKMPWLSIEDTFELKGPPGEITIEEASTEGTRGNEVAVCSCLFPMPFGRWQCDYFSMGLTIPAPYTVPNTEIQCTLDSIDCITSDGKVASTTRIWNDNWAPPHPNGGSTRCGTATMIDQKLLSDSMERLGRKLGYFIRLRIWNREKEYGDYSESERTLFLLD